MKNEFLILFKSNCYYNGTTNTLKKEIIKFYTSILNCEAQLIRHKINLENYNVLNNYN